MSILQLKKNITLNYADIMGAAYDVVQQFYHNDHSTYCRGYKFLMQSFDMRANFILHNKNRESRSRIFEDIIKI